MGWEMMGRQKLLIRINRKIVDEKTFVILEQFKNIRRIGITNPGKKFGLGKVR